MWSIDDTFYSSNARTSLRKRQITNGDIDKDINHDYFMEQFQKTLIDSFVTNPQVYERFAPNDEKVYLDSITMPEKATSAKKS